MKFHDDSKHERPAGLRSLAVLALMFLLTIPAVASAQEDGGNDVDDETAKKVLTLLRDGKELYDEENYQGAYDKFQEAYDLWPRPAIQARLGKAAEQLGNKKKALSHYRAYLEERPEGKMAEKVRSNAEGLEAELPARIAIRSTPSGATVFLGAQRDKRLGTTPLESEVESGSQTFVLEAEGHEATIRTYEMKAGKEKSVSIELTKKSETPAFGATGETKPTGGTSASMGPRKVPDTSQTLATWGWTTAIAGLAGIGTGTMFAYLKGQTTDDVNNLNRGAPGTTRQGIENLKETARRHHRTSLVAFSIGGALTAVGAGLLVQHYSSKGKKGSEKGVKRAESGVKLDFGFTSEGGWAGVRGEF